MRREAAQAAVHSLGLELDRLRAEGVVGHAAMVRALNERNLRAARDADTGT